MDQRYCPKNQPWKPKITQELLGAPVIIQDLRVRSWSAAQRFITDSEAKCFFKVKNWAIIAYCFRERAHQRTKFNWIWLGTTEWSYGRAVLILELRLQGGNHVITIED